MLYAGFEGAPQKLGDFVPVVLRLRLLCEKRLMRDRAEQLAYTPVFFHEFVHFLQAIGSTFNISTHFEVVEYIAQAIREMGGRADHILHGILSIADQEDYLKHFMGLHHFSLD